MGINDSTLEKALSIAEKEGVKITGLNALAFFKKALLFEQNNIGSIVDSCRHEFGKGAKIRNIMKLRVYSKLNA